MQKGVTDMKRRIRKVHATTDLATADLIFTTEQFGSFLRSLPQLADADISISACSENGILVMIGNMNYLFACEPELTTV